MEKISNNKKHVFDLYPLFYHFSSKYSILFLLFMSFIFDNLSTAVKTRVFHFFSQNPRPQVDRNHWGQQSEDDPSSARTL